MLKYQKPAVSAVASATSAIQGSSDKNIHSVPDAKAGDPTFTSGLAYDLDE